MPTSNASCSFLDYSNGWYNNIAYPSVEVSCDYGPGASMQLLVNLNVTTYGLVQV